MPVKCAPRLRGFSYRGMHRYFLTICVEHRDCVFTDMAPIEPVRTALQRTAIDFDIAVIAYCFMPDHLHVLVEGTSERANLREFVRVFKQRSSFQWKRRHGQTLWQRSYFEHVLRGEEDTVAVARYLLSNPVRAGMVSSPEEYPLLGSMTMELRDLLYSVTRY
jgi:putative transposase